MKTIIRLLLSTILIACGIIGELTAVYIFVGEINSDPYNQWLIGISVLIISLFSMSWGLWKVFFSSIETSMRRIKDRTRLLEEIKKHYLIVDKITMRPVL